MVSQLSSMQTIDRSCESRFSELSQNSWYNTLDLQNVAERYSSPLYICNRAQILRNLRNILELVRKPENVLFPVKSNPCLFTLRTLAEQGVGADCAAAHEIELARLSGIPSQRISYYSPTPDLALAASLLNDGGNIVLDCISHIQSLENLVGADRFPGKIFLRINPSFNVSYLQSFPYQKHTSHGDPFSQFGLPIEEVISALKNTTLPFSGLHVHVGSQMDNVDVFIATIQSLHDLSEQIHLHTDHQIAILNLGGGLGIPGTSEEEFPGIQKWVEALSPHLKTEFRYQVEPGNALIGNATALLTRVLTRKESRGKVWALVDVGTNQLTKVTLANFSQEVITQAGTSLPRSGPDAIAGPLCFAGDIILPETDLKGIEEGDLLLLPNTGSYCRAVGSRFNGSQEPGILWVDDEQEIGLANRTEDLFWEPTIQSFCPLNLPKREGQSEIFYKQKLEKLRSVYLNKQCIKDDYQFHNFTRITDKTYEVEIEVDSLVAFISAPLVMRIISDAAVVAYVDAIGKGEKDISVWGARFSLAIESILRTNHRHRLKLYITENANSQQGRQRAATAFWELGENRKCYGSIKILG